MYHTITAAANYAVKILNCHTSGVVHSVYRKTINLDLNGQLLALQTAASPISPISLITALDSSAMEALKAAPGQPVSIDSGALCLTGAGAPCIFSVTGAFIHDTALTYSLTPDRAKELYKLLKEAVSCSASAGFQPIFTTSAAPDSTLVLQAARNYIKSCGNYFSLCAYSQAAESLVRLLGLGIGLTPSGDDFLCGVLAGFTLSGSHEHIFAQHLREQIRKHLSGTNDISAAFLKCALIDQYSLAVIALASLPSSAKILSSFDCIGHSSGIDTLCGILYALELNIEND